MKDIDKISYGVFADLKQRGFVTELSPLEEERLAVHLNEGQRSVYCGFDPTENSLHLGHLVPILALRRFQQFGHRPIVLVGGATGLIGDPSGKAEERRLVDSDVVARRSEAIEKQLRRLLDFDTENGAIVVNNNDWISPLSLVEFLREVGKHFLMNEMLDKKFVADRLGVQTGLSFTEFSYTVFQGFDFGYLFQTLGCTIQVGGKDQWGNITNGIRYVRRAFRAEMFGLTFPLLLKENGTKFGKSEDGNIWLDPEKTSPFAMHQYLLQLSDHDALEWLPIFVLRPMSELEEVIVAHEAATECRIAQKLIADSVVEYVHGAEVVATVNRASQFLFHHSNDILLPYNELASLCAEPGIGYVTDSPVMNLVDVLVKANLAASKREARTLITQRGITWNGHVIEDTDAVTANLPWLHDRFAVVRRGRNRAKLLVQAMGKDNHADPLNTTLKDGKGL